MVVIRLRPQGKKRQKTYRIVVDNKRSKLDGKFIEDLGWLDRHVDNFNIDEERAKHWLSVGAQPSDTVHNLFVTAGIIDDKKRPVHSTRKRSEEVAEEPSEEPPKESKEETDEKEINKEEENEEDQKDSEEEKESDEDSQEDTEDSPNEDDGSDDEAEKESGENDNQEK